jgi:hypothetical protein
LTFKPDIQRIVSVVKLSENCVDITEMVMPTAQLNNNRLYLEIACDTHISRCTAAMSYTLSEFPLSKTHIPAKIRNTVNEIGEKCCDGLNSVY